MRIVTALVTALTLLGFGGAAFACEGYYKRSNADTAQTDKTPILPKDETS